VTLRQSLRALRATPGITVASILILALGIGVSTAVFSLVNGFLLRPLPVTDQDRLVRVWKNDVVRGFDHFPLSYPEYREWSRRSRQFESMAALWSWHTFEGILTGSGDPQRLEVSVVSENFFEVLGSSPEIGRALAAGDESATATPPLVLSYGVWRDLFGSDRSVVGKTIPLLLAERTSFQVVGVMPESFDGFAGAIAWAPTLAVFSNWANGTDCECDVIGRLAAGATFESALAELQSIHENLVSEDPERYRSTRVVMVPLLQNVLGTAGRASLLALGASGLLLALAIANAAGLSLIRAFGRTREVAIRSALGAGRVSLLRERLMETACIGAAGVLGGIAVAHGSLRMLIVLKGADLPRLPDIAIDARSLLFGGAAAALAILVCASVPAIFAPSESLGTRKAVSPGRFMQWMVILEIALALPVLFTATLLFRTLLASASIDRGLATEKLLSLELTLPASKYSDPESRLSFFEELVSRVQALPGVESVTSLPLTPGSGPAGISGVFVFEGQSEEEARDNPWTNVEMVSPAYFSVLGIPILRGRAFDDFDRLDSERVAIVSAEVAERYWPGQDPIGKTFGLRDVRSRVVGVAADTRYRELMKPWPTIYFSMRQNPFSTEPRLHPLLSQSGLAVRTRLAPLAMIGPVRRAVRDLDSEIPLDRVGTMEEVLDAELRQPKFHAAATSTFSFVALLLAAAGVYSVFAAFVAQRLPELGIRSALGATPARLRSLVLHRSIHLILAGIAAGSLGAFGVSRFLGGFVYGVAPFDVPTLLEAIGLLAAASLGASYVPARRAGRVDPLALLKDI
jgi:putative ABC transport system permease protein